MRKFILITAMVLVSATAQAGVPRGLTMAANDDAAAMEQPKSAETLKSIEAPKPVEEAPKVVERPAADTNAEPPKADTVKSVAQKDTQPLKVEKPKHRRESTEARVIYELHRNGIYW
jgi:hypothetical protein